MMEDGPATETGLSEKHRAKKQMPGVLSLVDDPYGIVWRLANLVRRTSPRRTLRFVRGWVRPPEYRRPILIVGMPRSGTQLLFHVLRESPELGSLPREGHDVWRRYHHPRRNGWRSDRVGQGELTPAERRFVSAYFFSYFGPRRFVEKTADNVVRVPYLLELFPDAVFIVLKRNPCDVLNSYINMWRHPEGRFRSYFVPADLRIPGYRHRHMWCSTLIDGWRNLTSAPVPELAFAQWSQYVEHIADARGRIPDRQWIELSFEEMLARPDETLAAVCERTGLAPDAHMRAKLRELVANPINALSPPGQEKWRTQNAPDILDLLPRIAAKAGKLGYALDPSTGGVAFGFAYLFGLGGACHNWWTAIGISCSALMM